MYMYLQLYIHVCITNLTRCVERSHLSSAPTEHVETSIGKRSTCECHQSIIVIQLVSFVMFRRTKIRKKVKKLKG